jgi:iron(III) transport system ATP-binding protein
MIPIAIQNVSKRFGAVRALADVSLDIGQGELFFLLGPSGCGKTTLLRSIAGFYIPEAGSIRFGERDVTQLAPQKRNTGMVFQNYALWPHMTVEANVAFGLRVRRTKRGERNTRVAEALRMVRMEEYAKRKPNQLSGGQQQRVALARALVIRPQCLLLDEPLSNLDAKLRLEMRTEIRRLCKSFGLTAIYVTHDQKEALSIADRMAVLFDGQVSQVGTPEALYRGPVNQKVADFLGESNFLPATIRGSTGSRRVLETALGPLEAECPDGPADGQCVAAIRPEACRLTSNGAENRFEAEVVERLYLGESTQLTLRVGDATLYARLVEHADTPAPRTGDRVGCCIDPQEVILLPN